MDNNRPVFTVSDINQYIKALLNRDENLKFIYVKGEISNFKMASNGHFYFSLKDDKAMISAMMFSSYAAKNTFVPENGQEVVVFGSIDAYPGRGTYQIIVYSMQEVGAGQALLELEKLKKKLKEEGLFDESRKRPINLYPKAIGVITAPNSAAIKDILFNLKRRYPIANIYVFYSAVQGDNAAKELLNAFNIAQTYPLDTLLIGRGGGSSEDLSAFNDETLVRALANSKMPIIACVGHEIDSTLVDFVADKRASTPTGAAELATIDQREILEHLSFSVQEMEESIRGMVDDLKDELSSYKEDLNQSILNMLRQEKQLLEHKKATLDALNPENVLQRGYTLTVDENGYPVKINDSKPGDTIKTIFKDGSLTSEVKEVEKK